MVVFFFQAEDGIRDGTVTGVQTCALPILAEAGQEQMVQGMVAIRFGQDLRDEANRHNANLLGYTRELTNRATPALYAGAGRSEERRVGKECRSRGKPYTDKEKLVATTGC